MTIATEAIVAGPFTGNGVNTTFSFAFKVFADTDVLVVHTDTFGFDRVAELNTDYLVTRNADQDGSPGGEIVWRVAGVTVALPVNEKVTLTSQVPATQATALPTGGKYSAKTVERMIDKVTILVKQFGRSAVRALRQPVSDNTVMNELPNASSRRGRYLYFEDTPEAQPIAVGLVSADIPISAFMQSLLDDADAAAARTTLGISASTTSGFMQTVLDDLNSAAARATLEIVTSAAPANLGPAAAVGVATQAARADHVHQHPLEAFIIAVSDEITNLTAGVAKVKFRMPYAFTVTAVRGSLSAAQTAGALLTVDVNESGVSILGTKLTFDNNETTTTTAATPATIADGSLADDAEISVDIDGVGTAGAKGLKIVLIGRKTA